MKKLLTLLSVALLGSTVVTPNILFNTTSEYENQEVNLNVRYFAEIRTNYCLPSCLQSILDYFGMNLNGFDQDRLYEELDHGDPAINIGNYLNSVMPAVTRRDYADNLIPVGFGQSMQEMALFQAYVLNSLLRGHPVLLRYGQIDNSGEPYGHVILITGIRTNADPQLTVYTAIDPVDFEDDDGSHEYTIRFNGLRLRDYYFSRYTSILTGYQSNPDFQREDVLIAIDDSNVDRTDLRDYQNQEVIRLEEDLTAITGINKTGELQEQYKNVSFDESTTQIELVTSTLEMEGFTIPFVKIPSNNDNWTSPIMTIHEKKESVGAFFRQGKVSAQLAFHRSNYSQHLMLIIIIYMAEVCSSVTSSGHVAINTGTSLAFSHK